MPQAPTLDRQQLLEEERLIIRHAGEIPEVAYHGCLHYLAVDPEGPGITLEPAERALLQAEVLERYRTIILRDLTPAFRGKRIYRGIVRSAINWSRLGAFCAREGCDASHLRPELAQALQAFLHQECADVREGRPATVNCSREELETFACGLGIACESLPEGWRELPPGG